MFIEANYVPLNPEKIERKAVLKFMFKLEIIIFSFQSVAGEIEYNIEIKVDMKFF